MTDQMSPILDDPWLIKAFRDFEHMPTLSQAEMDWSITTDFKVFSEFLIADIRAIQARLPAADDAYLYYVCEHIFNIVDWMTLIVTDNGAVTFVGAFEKTFEKEFGDPHILQHIYTECLERWLDKKSGQQKIGQNFYTLYDGNLYYRNRLKQWFVVDKMSAFDLKPKRKIFSTPDIIKQLNATYRETWYDAILAKWESRQYAGTLTDDFLLFPRAETTPEEYDAFTAAHTQELLAEPVSIRELERWHGAPIEDLEETVKICALVLAQVNEHRRNDAHTLYLLRDCLVFYEVNRALNVLRSEEVSADQILIGRKLLSQKTKPSGYYILALTALYEAHLHYPNNFDNFYADYARLLDIFVASNQEFAALITDLAEYINRHIRTKKKKIIIFDIGFQGSIALFTKYIIDRRVRPTGSNEIITTDIKIGVGALWSKKLFGERHVGDYFPFLNRAQLLARSNNLYHYQAGSFHAGQLRVMMGDAADQHKATIEFVVLMMVTLLAETERPKSS